MLLIGLETDEQQQQQQQQRSVKYLMFIQRRVLGELFPALLHCTHERLLTCVVLHMKMLRIKFSHNSSASRGITACIIYPFVILSYVLQLVRLYSFFDIDLHLF